MTDTTTTARPPLRYFELMATPIPKPGGKRPCEIRVTRDRGRTTWRYNLRLWVLDDSGEWRPTQRGLAFAGDKLLAVRDALTEAARRGGILDDE